LNSFTDTVTSRREQ